MQPEIKFRYRIQDKAGKVITQIYTLEEIEMGLLSKCYGLDYKILSRDQSTNLRDKNGKEIYWGDILKKEGHHDRLVKWEKDAFVVQYINAKDLNEYQQKTLPRLSKYEQGCKIIGNIYENPEFLT